MKKQLIAISLLFSVVHAATRMPDTLPLAISGETVVFPNQITPIYVADKRILDGIHKALEGDGLIFALAARPRVTHLQYFDLKDLYHIGTVAQVLQITPLPEGTTKVIVKGIARASAYEVFVKNAIFNAELKYLEYSPTSAQELHSHLENIRELIELASNYNIGELSTLIADEVDPEKIAQQVISYLSIQGDTAQALLECTTHDELLQEITTILAQQLGSVATKDTILKKTMNNIKEIEKKYYLQEQMKAIKQELGTDKTDDLATRLAALPLPEEIRKEVDRELDRYEMMSPSMPEHAMIQNYLEWIAGLPWGIETDDNLVISHAQEILNEDHYGLEEIKERVLDYLAIRNLTKDNTAPILCFVGPPGTGKTSLAKSIARSIGRHFQRLSVGGMYDETEIRGHRRTYIGALPGRFIESIKKAGSINPVILIDEIDKIGRSNFQGNPSSALLEVLDPEQNNTFRDNYLGAPFDLSKVLFIATANTLETIPRPLLDRMEIIKVSGYTPEEKSAIARNYLIKKAIKSSGLEGYPMTFSDEVLKTLIAHYTLESGVRELERVLKKLCAKLARRLVEGKELISFTPDNLETYLGPKKIIDSDMKTEHQVGVTNGLAWTAVGGNLLKVEAIIMPGKGKLLLTGSLGEVMKESAQTALSYARSHAAEFSIAPEVFKNSDIHIHVPDGATPKDGPSAGITLLSSILSALTGRKVNGEYAMTGELNLTGNVMPIGGVKEKILAAKRNAMLHVILPMKNKKDLVGIEEVTKDIDLIFVNHADEVLQRVLIPQENGTQR